MKSDPAIARSDVQRGMDLRLRIYARMCIASVLFSAAMSLTVILVVAG